MFVAPAWRGKGLGMQLLEQALAFADAMPGLRQVTLTVTAGNAAAVTLYESMGFVVFGRAPDALLVDGVSHDDIQMVRAVKAGMTFRRSPDSSTASAVR